MYVILRFNESVGLEAGEARRSLVTNPPPHLNSAKVKWDILSSSAFKTFFKYDASSRFFRSSIHARVAALGFDLLKIPSAAEQAPDNDAQACLQ